MWHIWTSIKHVTHVSSWHTHDQVLKATSIKHTIYVTHLNIHQTRDTCQFVTYTRSSTKSNIHQTHTHKRKHTRTHARTHTSSNTSCCLIFHYICDTSEFVICIWVRAINMSSWHMWHDILVSVLTSVDPMWYMWVRDVHMSWCNWYEFVTHYTWHLGLSLVVVRSRCLLFQFDTREFVTFVCVRAIDVNSWHTTHDTLVSDLTRIQSALQCVAVCCSALQCVAVCCSVLVSDLTRIHPLAWSSKIYAVWMSRTKMSRTQMSRTYLQDSNSNKKISSSYSKSGAVARCAVMWMSRTHRNVTNSRTRRCTWYFKSDAADRRIKVTNSYVTNSFGCHELIGMSRTHIRECVPDIPNPMQQTNVWKSRSHTSRTHLNVTHSHRRMCTWYLIIQIRCRRGKCKVISTSANYVTNSHACPVHRYENV